MEELKVVASTETITSAAEKCLEHVKAPRRKKLKAYVIANAFRFRGFLHQYERHERGEAWTLLIEWIAAERYPEIIDQPTVETYLSSREARKAADQADRARAAQAQVTASVTVAPAAAGAPNPFMSSR